MEVPRLEQRMAALEDVGIDTEEYFLAERRPTLLFSTVKLFDLIG